MAVTKTVEQHLMTRDNAIKMLRALGYTVTPPQEFMFTFKGALYRKHPSGQVERVT